MDDLYILFSATFTKGLLFASLLVRHVLLYAWASGKWFKFVLWGCHRTSEPGHSQDFAILSGEDMHTSQARSMCAWSGASGLILVKANNRQHHMYKNRCSTIYLHIHTDPEANVYTNIHKCICIQVYRNDSTHACIQHMYMNSSQSSLCFCVYTKNIFGLYARVLAVHDYQ